jgi:hypothetical protein
MHRYGRHGTRAWLRWRNRHFCRAHLVAPSPRVVVLNVQVEFLARIQKVVLVMQDGSRFEMENNVSQLEQNGQNIPQNTPSADERFLEFAFGLGKLSAEKDYEALDDPFTSRSSTQSEIEYEAHKLYLSMLAHGDSFTAWSNAQEAIAEYLRRFDMARLKRLEELSGATTRGTQRLWLLLP